MYENTGHEGSPSAYSLSSRRGFTLVEIAFVLVLVGILVGFGVQMLPMLVKQNKLKEDRAFVKQTRTAIIGYALATGSRATRR